MKKLNLKMIACLSILVALAVVLKTLGFMIGTNMRISFFAVPLLMAGLIGGITPGLVAAFVADLVYGLFFNSYGYNPIYTISALFWGLSGGILSYSVQKKGKLSWILLIVMVLVTSVLETCNNAVWDLVLYGNGTTMVLMGYKFITILIKLPVMVIVTKILYDRVIKGYLKI